MLNRVDGRHPVRRATNERFVESCVTPIIVVESGFVHVWGSFHHGTVSGLVLLDRNVNAALNRDVLHGNMLPWARADFRYNFRFQHDHAPEHRARQVTKRMSSCSPNLQCRQTWTLSSTYGMLYSVQWIAGMSARLLCENWVNYCRRSGRIYFLTFYKPSWKVCPVVYRLSGELAGGYTRYWRVTKPGQYLHSIHNNMFQ